MPCSQCVNPTLCTSRCQAYAEELKQCAASGQMTEQQVAAHVEAGEMPGPRCDRCNDSGWWYSDPFDPNSLEPCCDFPAPKGEAGEMEAGKEDRNAAR